MLIFLQREFVKQNADGCGLQLFSSQFVEHIVKLLKQTCSRHSNNQSGWCLYVSRVQDIFSMGGTYLEMIDLHNIAKKRERIDGYLFVTDQSARDDDDAFEDAPALFQEFVRKVEKIEFGKPIPDNVKHIVETGYQRDQLKTKDFLQYSADLLYQQHNVQSGLTQTDWDDDIEEKLSDNIIAGSRVHVPNSSELPNDLTDPLSVNALDSSQSSDGDEIAALLGDNLSVNVHQNEMTFHYVRQGKRRQRLREKMDVEVLKKKALRMNNNNA